MKKDKGGRVALQITADVIFLPLVRASVEKAAAALGLGKQSAHDLAMAAREVFAHLCRVILEKNGAVEIRCSSGGHYVLTEFSFIAAELDLRAFNLGAGECLTDDQSQTEAGLMSASRLVDRFAVTRREGRGLKLHLLKEKSYPLLEEFSLSVPPSLAEFTVRAPSAAELNLLARLVKTCYSQQPLPEVINYPGKLVDMLSGANYGAAVAVGPAGELVGGTFWHRGGPKEVEFFGPYVFNQNNSSEIAGALVDNCIGAMARTDVAILMNRFTTPEFPRDQFEFLGRVLLCTETSECLPREAWFRLMQEDEGSIAWVSPELEDFLRQEYARLVLPREIRRLPPAGERQPRHSVLSTQVYRWELSATLRPMWYGTDFEQNLARHLKLLCQEGIPNIFFFLDAGESWQTVFTAGLLQNGFQPRLILPFAGVGDVVVLQFQGTAP